MSDDPSPTTEDLIKGLKNANNWRIADQQRIKQLERELAEAERQRDVAQGINRQQPVTQEQLEAKDAEIAELTAKCAGQETRAADQDAVIAQQQTEIAELEQKYAELERDHGELTAAVQATINGPQAGPEPNTTVHGIPLIDNAMDNQNAGRTPAPTHKGGRGWGRHGRSK